MPGARAAVVLESETTDETSWFHRPVARQDHRSRIGGCSPTCVVLTLTGSARSKLLHYDQAVEPDGTSCVRYASVA